MKMSVINNDLDMMQLEVLFMVLDIIEQRFATWFKNRKGMNDTQKHDVLANHINIIYNGYGVYFTFKKGSDLPVDIKDQCLKAYRILFPTEICYKGDR